MEANGSILTNKYSECSSLRGYKKREETESLNRICALQSNPGNSMMILSDGLVSRETRSSSRASKPSKGTGKKLVQIESQESRELNSRRMKPKQSENKERKESEPLDRICVVFPTSSLLIHRLRRARVLAQLPPVNRPSSGGFQSSSRGITKSREVSISS